MARKKPESPEPVLAERPYAEVDGVRVNPRLVEHLIPVRNLIPDPANARTHGERNLKAVESSLKRFGFQLPVLYDPETMHVVAGNGRLQVASERLGWTKVPAIPFHGTPEELAAYAIMDNRTAELAEWDWQRLAENLRPLVEGDLFTGDELGFEPFELEPLMHADWSPPDPEDTREEFDKPDNAKTIKTIAFTEAQWARVSKAIEAARAEHGKELPESEATAVVADVYLQGNVR